MKHAALATQERRQANLVASCAAVAFLASGVTARRGLVGRIEQQCFHVFNGLPAGAFAPVWVVMQLGSLGGVVVSAGAARAVRHRPLAVRLATRGTCAWVLAKLIKPVFRRGRPEATLDRWRVLGREQAGLGFPSGHTAVVTTLALITAREVPCRWRPSLWVLAAGVSASRMYVGAHLPLDVIGGAAIGVGIGSRGPDRGQRGPSRSQAGRRPPRRRLVRRATA